MVMNSQQRIAEYVMTGTSDLQTSNIYISTSDHVGPNAPGHKQNFIK